MKRTRVLYFMLVCMFLSISIAGCAGEIDDRTGVVSANTGQPPAAEFPGMAELEDLLVVGRVSCTENHMQFTLRNISDVTLYYDTSYELYHDVNGKWEPEHSRVNDVMYSIDPGIVRNYGNEWSDLLWEKGEEGIVALEPGRYMFVRKIYTDRQDMDSYEYLRIEFNVIAWDDKESPRPDWRQERIDFAVLSPASENIVLTGAVDVSRNGAAFSLENRSDRSYTYGLRWELARYANGRWLSVPFTVENGVPWPDIALWLQSGGIKHEYMDWSFMFGELQPGRYMFIREYYPSDEYLLPDRRYTEEYTMVEFVIDDSSPLTLPPQEEQLRHVMLAEYRDVTPTGMTVVIDNVSVYDFTFHAYAGSIYLDGTMSLSTLPDYLWSDYDEWPRVVFSSGSRLEYELEWESMFGALPPGEYSIYINAFGDAPPPHPVGRFQEVLEAVVTIS